MLRLALLQQVLAAVLIVSFSGSAIWLSARALEKQESAFLSNAATLMVESLEREWREESDLRRAAASALEEDATPGVEITVLDDRGQRVVSTARGVPGRPAAEMRTMRIHVPKGAWVVTSVSTGPRRDAIAALGLALLLTSIPLFVAVVAVSRMLAGQALWPLSRMAVQAERASVSGGMQPLGRPTDPAEVRRLAGAFNRLLGRLEETLRAEQQFTQDAAHEMRTPLTVLSGELEYALANDSLSQRDREGLRRASDQARTMRDLVEALLLLRRTDPLPVGERGEFAAVNLSDLVRETSRDLLTRSPERRQDLEITADDEVMVAGHATLLASAIHNLLSNALKFTEPGQAIRVDVRASDGQCSVIVDDAGRGIAPENRERVFDPFFRDPEARAGREGFGLGLPILRRVARAHGGEVTAAASALGGARFELRLPAWAPRV